MLGSYFRLVINEINDDISELVQKMTFIKYSH